MGKDVFNATSIYTSKIRVKYLQKIIQLEVIIKNSLRNFLQHFNIVGGKLINEINVLTSNLILLGEIFNQHFPFIQQSASN